MTVERNLIESILGHVLWTSPDVGYAHCPGEDLHGNGKVAQDALVRFDRNGVAYVFCFHTSCRQRQNEANSELKSLFTSHGMVVKRPKSGEEKEREARAKELRRATWLARHRVLPELIKHPVPLDEWIASSPFDVGSLSHEEQSRAFISGLFRPERKRLSAGFYPPGSPLWCGDLFMTGEGYEDRFRSRDEWLKSSDYGQQFGTVEFRYNTINRKRENMLLPVISVLESDVLTPEQFGSVINYARKYSTLRSITHTGNKSVHAAFDPIFSDELLAVLEGLGCDRNVMRYALTTRLPGIERKDREGIPTGKFQKLLFLNPVFEVVL